MTIEFELDKDDFLAHQLYISSKSERVKNKRRFNRFVYSALYFVLAVLFFFQDNIVKAVLLLSLAILWFVLYPLWERKRYIKHYQSFIRENFKDRFNKPAIVVLEGDVILARDGGSESKVSTSELVEIVEIPTNIFLRLKGGQSFILPKNKLAEVDKVIERLKSLAAGLGIEYREELHWKWK